MTYNDLSKENGIVHLPGTKTKNSKQEVEVNSRDIIHINSKLARLPNRINGKLFSVIHTLVSKSLKKSKEVIELNNDYITPYSLRHTHKSSLLSKAIPIEYMSKRLGHSRIS
ncbi:integrase (fragment) [Staphylococcus argenteus]